MRLRAWWAATRSVDASTAAALARRWAELPAHVRTPAQTLGQHALGCEGTHGVFPRCNLACTPCYHSRDANRIRVDGTHTRDQVGRQLALLQRLRGPRAHAQLIGGGPRIVATQQRLRACSYTMAHPESGELVPACVQHSVLDPVENATLLRLLPLRRG